MNPLSYCLVVRCGPNQQSQALSAFEFARELLAQGHRLERVFFYQQGVLTASSLRTPAQGELNITHQWQQLQEQHPFGLDVCIAAALQNGIVDENESQRYQLHSHNLASGFELAGLGQLASATATCDRVITFGANV
ncbi:MAG: sulfurtransferase complex subunit TusD [Gammaproteobacteria bacterium]|nr:sulfurtransferase complex subunit TusD [Gammaproteobacteria bacterium]MCP4881330.1 sulfurtransferase complex subunit TusD [Gammaproteobacteria bacterium]